MPGVIKYVALIVLLTTALKSAGQPQPRIFQYTKAEGLDATLVDEVVQDGRGFIWLNHNLTLSRFDGYRFKTYAHDPDDSLMQLGPQFLGNLIVDELGILWVNNMQSLLENGTLLRYQATVDGFIPYKPDVKFRVNTIAADDSGSAIWIGTTNGIYGFDLTSRKTVYYPNPMTDELDITGIGSAGSFLHLYTESGLWLMDKASGTYSRPPIPPQDSTLLFSGPLIKYFAPGWVQVPAHNKVIRLDSSLRIIEEFELPDAFHKRTLQHSAGTLDHNNIFWFVGDDGLYRYNPADRAVAYYKQDFGWATGEIVDRENNVWLFGWNLGLRKVIQPELIFFDNSLKDPRFRGGNLQIIKPGDKEFSVITGAGSQDFDNAIWTGTIELNAVDFSPLDFAGKHDRPSNPIQIWPGKKYYWIATWGRGVLGIPYDSAKSRLLTTGVRNYSNTQSNPYTLISDRTWTVYEDQGGDLWVGTTEGVCRIRTNMPYGVEGSVSRFVHNAADTNSIADNVVRHLYPETATSFWVSTTGGLDLFENGRFRHLLKNVFVHDVFKTSSGELYVRTQSGLYRGRASGPVYHFEKISEAGALFSVEDKQENLWGADGNDIIFFSPQSGLTISIPNVAGGEIAAIAQSSTGMIAISTYDRNSIITFDPSTFSVSGNLQLPLITDLRINNKSITARKHRNDNEISIGVDITLLEDIELDYLHNNLELEFTAMEMNSPEKNLFRHMLEGYEDDWVASDYRDRVATYTNLAAGTYTFRVKASNHHGVWNDKERTLKVVILPAPWRTWWAYAGYTMIFGGLLWWGRRNIVQRERLTSNLKVSKLEQEMEHVELEKAREVDKLKNSFFANISHEFRTPLTLIQGPVQDLLEKAGADRKTRDKLKLIQRNSELLLKLINQLLDLAKLESGSLKVENTKGELTGFVRAVVSAFGSHAEQKDVRLSAEVQTTPIYATFDKDKLEAILINLVNNAIKFTPAGGRVIVTARIEEEGALLIEVQDNGIGIPAEYHEKIFERFQQVNESHKEVGTGIGLALVKELVQLMNGSIQVKSTLNEGSLFTVTLPIEVVAADSAVKELTPRLENGDSVEPLGEVDESRLLLTGLPVVLLVEDNTDLRKFIIDSLGTEFNFLEAADGKQGLDLAGVEIPDLIISDVMMPEMDGITMAGKIRKDIRTSHIPLILLTAKSTDYSRTKGLEGGADDYLTKPFNKSELLLKVRNGISRQQKLREKLRAELMTMAPKVEVQSADEKFLVRVKESVLARLGDDRLSVESLAEEIGMSRVQLYRKLTALTGMSVNEFIRKFRLEKAGQLLSQRWGSVSQVAYEVGFSNLSYFSKVFKEEFGNLPSEHV